MTMKILLIFSCVLIGWAQSQRPFYLINIPNSLTNDLDYNFLVRSSENIRIQINTLEKRTNTTVIGPHFLIAANKSFNIPYFVRFRNVKKLTLIIRADRGEIDKLTAQTMIRGSFINKSIEVPIYKSGDMMFGETSQPLYKPGQLVKFRIFALHFSNLKVSQSMVKQWQVKLVNGKYVKTNYKKPKVQTFSSIAVINPKKQKMREWTDVNMTTAMNLSYQLLKDPVFGKWKIVAKLDGKKETIYFTVKKFVLPRFVVNVKPPKQMLFSDKSIEFSVCATYSTGKPMKADLEGKFCILRYETVVSCRVFSKSTAGVDKCATITIQTKDLGIAGSTQTWRYTGGSVVNVTVTEKGTDLSVFKSVKGKGFSRNAYKIKMLSNNYFKPGLPYFGKLKLTKISGEPQINETVEIKLRSYRMYGNYFGFVITATTDNNGIADFILPFIKTKESLNLDIKSVKEYKSPMYTPSLYKTLKQWNSIDNKYIEILKTQSVLDPSKIVCPGNLKLSLLTNMINSTDMKDSPQIHVQMFGRGQLQYNSVENMKLDGVQACVPRDNYLGHFECLDNGNIKCLQGWTGDNCREPVCKGGCVNGACISPDNCVCNSGWKGNSCDLCIPLANCKNGDCVRGNDCRCKPGWVSRYCDKKGPFFRSYKTTTPKPINTTTAAPVSNNKIRRQTIFQYDIVINLPDASIGPDVHIIVYMLTKNGEVVGDQLELQLENCVTNFGANTTKFEFVNGDMQMPGAKVSLKLDTGTKQKDCAVRINDVAIDQFGRSSTLDLNSLITDLKRLNHELINARGWYYGVDADCIKKPEKAMIMKRMILPYYNDNYDTNSAFKKSGMKVITNLRLVNSFCRTYQIYYDRPMSMHAQRRPALGSGRRRYKVSSNTKTAQKTKSEVKIKIKKVKEKIRQFFPANWIFQYHKNTPNFLNYTAPDSITTWKANSFCFTEKGLYLSPTKYLKVLQPFYVDLYLPYSIKLTEKLKVPVKIFNYMNECYEIRVDLKVDAREIKISGASSFTICTCAQQIRTMYFEIEPIVIGEGLNITVFARSSYSKYCSIGGSSSKGANVAMRDAIRRKLKVEAPGVPHESTLSELICVGKNDTGVRMKGFHELPNDIFPGSLRTYLAIVGNVLGSSLDDLSRLVRLPSGCGEQNMAKTVPAIYVLDFLRTTQADKNGDNQALANRTLKYVKTGVRNQKKYQHPDGSYSAFGPGRYNKEKGSTWLTAFVIRSFSAASQLGLNIVNKKTIQKAVDYIASTQESKTGSFKERGRLLSSALSGGTNAGRGSTDAGLLTSYVAIAIGSAARGVVTDKIDMSAALKFIRDDLKRDNSSSTYRLALAAYAHVINDKESKFTKQILKNLIEAVEDESRYKFWRSTKSASKTWKNSNSWKRYFTSADIETTGYAFLAISKAKAAPFNMLSVVSWLTNQQSSLGGYYSTQDTAVALQALSVFASQSGAIQTKDLSLQVEIKSLKGKKSIKTETHKRRLTSKNRLITHKTQLDALYSKETSVAIKAQGEGCAVVQLVSLYTIMSTNANLTGKDVFKVTAEARCQSTKGNKQAAKVRVCSEYLRKDQSQPEGGMVIVTVALPSGWRVTKATRDDLRKQADQIKELQNIEFPSSNTQMVNLYYRGFSYKDAEESRQRCFTIPISMSDSIEISNLQRAVVRISDYYRPELYVDTDYSIPCRVRAPLTTPAPPVPTCPSCEDVDKLGGQLLTDLCSLQSGVMLYNATLALSTDSAWSFIKPYSWNYLEWNVTRAQPSSCQCIQKMWSNKQNALMMTSYYFRVEETTIKLNKMVQILPLDSPRVLRTIFSSDISRQCSSMKNIHKLLSWKLGYDWGYLTKKGLNQTAASVAMESCPTYISADRMYYHVKNYRQFFCSNNTAWTLLEPTFSLERNSTTSFAAVVHANLTNGNVTTPKLTLQFPVGDCYAFMKMSNNVTAAAAGKPVQQLFLRVKFQSGDDVVYNSQSSSVIALSKNDTIIEEDVYRTKGQFYYCKQNRLPL